jgi:hypothetical protein
MKNGTRNITAAGKQKFKKISGLPEFSIPIRHQIQSRPIAWNSFANAWMPNRFARVYCNACLNRLGPSDVCSYCQGC